VLFERLIVLLVKVSVVARPTRVSVLVGKESVPVLKIEEMTGVVSVGEVPKTSEPVPVSSVTAEATWEEVATKVLLARLKVLLVRVAVLDRSANT
jgi:hypothetical protein